MEENKREYEPVDHGIAVKPSLKSRIDNFWYHYKWHSLVSLFVIIAIVVCSVQMCSKTSFDNYVMYAGGYSVSRAMSDDVAEYVKITSSLERVSEDYNGDKETACAFLDLYIPTPDKPSDAGSDVQHLTMENISRIEYELVSGSEYYVCFLSEYVYSKYKFWDDVQLFLPLLPYANGMDGLVYYDDCAVYLSSTAFSRLDGLKNLPDDTLICLRSMSAVASFFDRGANRRNFERGEELLRKILSYGIE